MHTRACAKPQAASRTSANELMRTLPLPSQHNSRPSNSTSQLDLNPSPWPVCCNFNPPQRRPLIKSRRIKELVPAQPGEEEPQERVRMSLSAPSCSSGGHDSRFSLFPEQSFVDMTSWEAWLILPVVNSIKKPKTHRYPSLKGTDPKFRRNHRHALHGTMRALVRTHAERTTLRNR